MSKTRPVSSWRSQRQAGAMQALQPEVWSLIFFVFGVHMVNAEQGSQAQQRKSEKDFYQTPQVDVPRKKRMPLVVKKEKEKRNSQGKDPRTFKEPVERWRVKKKRSQGRMEICSRCSENYRGNCRLRGSYATSGGVFVAVDGNLGAVVGVEEGAIGPTPR